MWRGTTWRKPIRTGASFVGLGTHRQRVVLRNRGAGPFGLLNMIEERCGGTFDNVYDVISAWERAEFMAAYKMAEGFAIEALNKAPPTITSEAWVRAA